MDMAAAVEFDLAAARRTIESVRPGMRVFGVSSKTGVGIDHMMKFLKVQRSLAGEGQFEATL
jgi:hydrogenase nickel incorporation protein HypB